MHRWIKWAALLGLLLMASGARADEGGTPFAKVSPIHWAYASVRRLERAGYFTGSPAGTFDGRQPRTRYEFAVAVERLYRSFQPQALSATEPDGLREDLVVLRRLILGEFAPEVAGLGRDLAEVRRQLGALDQRLARLEKASRTEPDAPRLAALAAALKSPGGFGLQPRLQTSLFYDLSAGLKPGVTTGLGPARLGVSVDQPDSLTSVPGLPLEDPNAGRSIRAQLSLPVGSYLLSAYYSRLGGLWDRYGLGDSRVGAGPTEGVGAEFSGALNSRVGFQFQGGTFRSVQDDPERTLYLSGGLSLALGNGFNLGAGYERTRQLGLGGALGDSSGYFMNFGRSFGRYTRLDIRYRDGGAGNSSAMTQISVKF